MGMQKYRAAGPPAAALVTQTTIKELLKEAKLINFKDELPSDLPNEKSWKGFQTKHTVRLCKTSANKTASHSSDAQGEVLHHLAEFGLDGLHDFVIWVIKYHPPLLECTNNIEGGESPLHTAIRHGNHDFVKLLLDNADPVILLRQVTAFNYTCLHTAIEYRCPFTECIIEKAQKLYTSTQNHVIGSNGIEEKRSGVTAAAPNIIQSNIFVTKVEKNGDDKDMTPLHFAAITLIKDDKHGVHDNTFAEIKQQPDVNVKGSSYAQGETSEKSQPNTGKLTEVPETLGSNETEKSAEKNGIDGNFPEFNLLRVVKKLIEAHPQVLIDYKDKDGDTPFQSRLTFLQYSAENKNKGDEKEKANVKSVEAVEERRLELIRDDPVLRYMREYIIDKFDRRDAMKALYKVGDERVIEFDLSGLPHPTINMEFFNGLGKVLRFEGLLKYVALPRLVVEDDEGFGSAHTAVPPKGNIETEQISQAKGRGLQHMYSIFRWLKERHVESVLKVTVIDDVEPSHSDEIIENCMKNLNTRVWNWYKVDLCCDVIQNSAPFVEDVTLYSSGNNAVLVGWSCSEGLAKLEELKRVHVCFQEGLEKPKRLQGYINTFNAELKKHKPDVIFTWEIRKHNQNYNSIFTERNLERTIESRWIRTMKNFGAFLKVAKPEKTVRPVKIAIIDDGIDMRLEIFNNKVQVGESFYSLGELSGRRGAYYVPSGPHGTLMAQLICEICPVAKLYVAQLEVLSGENGRRSFNAQSATDAILWAVSQGVDIISMSWSIEDNSGSQSSESADLQKMGEALIEATKQKIILFCSSIDEGATASDTTYPGKVHSCIKIGASTGDGTKLSWVSNKNSKFLVPGEGLQPTSISNPWNNTNLGSVGSSVSTALAAGLAGDLLYCERLIRADGSINDTNSQILPKNGDSDGLRGLKKMEKAFQYISKGTQDDKFLQVWDHLELGPEALAWDEKSRPEDTKLTKEKLSRLMKNLHHV